MKVKVNVRDYGAKGNGVADDRAAIQAAVDYVSSQGGGTVYAPAGTYIVSKPFDLKSYITLRGDGNTSIIRNKVVKKNADDQFCLHIGNMSPSSFLACARYTVSDIKAGDNQVKLKDKSNASSFAIGQAVLVDTTDGFINTDGKFKPYAAFINRVKAIWKDSGIIGLEDPVSVDVANAKIAVTSTGKDYVCINPIVKNIRFESLYGDWTMRFGCYKGLFDNISVKSTDFISGNGFSHCTFKNIQAEYSQKVLEMAIYSHDTIVDGLIATWWNGLADASPLFKMGENVRNCSFTNMNIDAGQGQNFGMVIRFEHAFNNKIYNNTFDCTAVDQNAVELTTSDNDAIVTGNEVKNNRFIMGNLNSHIKIDTGGSQANISGNNVTGNTFSGTVNNNTDVSGGSNNTITPNTYL